jgi:group II intron reverse transcriptase/maturase
MRVPERVLNSLVSKAGETNYMYRDLYRNLYNPLFYLMAYENIYSKTGNMTQGQDGKTIDGMSLERIHSLVSKVKDESYQPNPVKRIYIPKSNGKKRPLGIPSVDDKLVQEVVRILLEAIYEGSFSPSSHGFRPNRSCHTALQNVVKTFTGVKWFIEGDIKGFFDNIDHHALINILRKSIDDEKFINLIWKFLRAGFVDDWQFNNTYSGTPQGSIISPILSNIYLNELDEFVFKYKKTLDIGTKKRRNPVHRSIMESVYKREKYLLNNGNYLSNDERKTITLEIKSLRNEAINLNTDDPMDASFRRLQYVRYADDFIIGIIGSKEEAVRIKQGLTDFLQKELKLELSQEKTLITHSNSFARFLGYDITVRRTKDVKRDKNGVLKKAFNLKCKLYLPKEKWISKLMSYGALEFEKGTDKWNSKHRSALIHRDDLEIVSIYNAEIRGIYNYYKLASNVSVLNKFYYIMRYSMLKTYGNKYKCSVKQIVKKYQVNGEFAINFHTKSGMKARYFYNNGFKKQSYDVSPNLEVDTYPNTYVFGGRTSLTKRLLAYKCEWCERDGLPIEIHHVRKLKDLKGKKKWEHFMIALQRKTLALCTECHKALHIGKLD